MEDFALAARLKGLSRETVRGLFNLLRLIFLYAVRQRILIANPAARAKVPKVEEDHKPSEKPKRNSIILETEA